MTETVTFVLNGEERSVDTAPATPLLYVLRGAFGLNGAKYGCGLAQCGACNVEIDGRVRASCTTPVSAVAGRSITTVEGFASGDAMHPLQRAFVKHQAAQCGYCVAGILVSAKALLDRNPDPSDAEIRTALDGNLCRCGTHTRIIAAVKTAAEEMRA